MTRKFVKRSIFWPNTEVNVKAGSLKATATWSVRAGGRRCRLCFGEELPGGFYTARKVRGAYSEVNVKAGGRYSRF